MCDFHSIVVRRDGAKAHVASNSHSGAVSAAGWRENGQMADMRGKYFVECEWNGTGPYPGADTITRGVINEKQCKAIDIHYEALARFMADPGANAEEMLFGDGFFAGEEYGDLRWKALISETCPPEVVGRLVTSKLHSDGMPIKSLCPSVAVIGGTLRIAPGYHIEVPALVKVGGNVRVAQNGTLTAPALAECGDVTVAQNGTLTAPALVKVGGYVIVEQNGTLTVPALVKVGGDVIVEQNGTLTVPALAECGYVIVEQNGTLTAPALVKVGGYVRLAQSGTLTAPALAKVGGYVRLAQSGTLTAPALAECGYVRVEQSGTLTAPTLKR